MRTYQIFKRPVVWTQGLKRGDISFDNTHIVSRTKKSLALEKTLAETKDAISGVIYKQMDNYDLSALVKGLVRNKTGIYPTNGKLKMHEMFITFENEILGQVSKSGKNKRVLKGFNIAEFPGHFISAILDLEKVKDFIYDWVAQSYLTREDEESSILKPDTKLFTEYRDRWLMNLDEGINGDLMDLNILKYYKDYFADEERKVHLATADGGMSVVGNYNEQERVHFGLIAGEIYAAMCSLRPNGVFILKIFSTFENTTWGMIHTLRYMFKRVLMHKPYTSRDRNDEKYVVCIGFRGINEDAMRILLDIVNGVKAGAYPLVGKTKSSQSAIDTMLTKSHEYNALFVKKEILRLNYLERIINAKRKNGSDRKRAEIYMRKYY